MVQGGLGRVGGFGKGLVHVCGGICMAGRQLERNAASGKGCKPRGSVRRLWRVDLDLFRGTGAYQVA